MEIKEEFKENGMKGQKTGIANFHMLNKVPMQNSAMLIFHT